VFKHGGKKWKTIATLFCDKTPSACNQRWNELQDHGSTVKKPWCPSEDNRMIDLVKTHGPGKWAVIASYLPGRNGKQCRERWHNQLNPDIKKDPWTVEEDEIIREMQSKYGNRWAKITEKLPGRTDNAVKNHWHSSMKSKLKRSSTSVQMYLPNPHPSSAGASPTNEVVKEELDQSEALPLTPRVEYGEIKLEPGSLSPDCVAICPSQLEPALRGDYSLFSLDDAGERDENVYFAPSEVLCVAPNFSCGEYHSENGYDGNDDSDSMGGVLDGLGDEELVLSTDLHCGKTSPSTLHLHRILDQDVGIASSDANESVSSASAFEPSQHDASLLSSLDLIENDILDVKLLEVLSNVSTDCVDHAEVESVTPESEDAMELSPPSTPAMSSFAAEWGTPTHYPSTFVLAPPPDPGRVDATACAASFTPQVQAPDMDLRLAVPLSITDATMCGWLLDQLSSPSARSPDGTEADGEHVVWDLM
jgi:hypothetical protein